MNDYDLAVRQTLLRWDAASIWHCAELQRRAEAAFQLSRDAQARADAARNRARAARKQEAKLRVWTAELAEDIADGAEGFAAYLEDSAAARRDQQHRLTMATTEHEVVRIANQNASTLRDLRGAYERGERMPKLLGANPTEQA